MQARAWLRVVMLAGLFLLAMRSEQGVAVAPPARLSAAQSQRLALRDRWLQRANTRYAAGQIAETITALQRAMALERAVFGTLGPAPLPWLAFLARLQEQQELFAEALAARQERWRCLRRYHGDGGWQVQDALLDIEDCRFLARLNGKQRQRLRQAEQWNGRVVRLWQEGKSHEALPLGEKALATRREILGETHRLTAETWLNLGALHQALQRAEEAERSSRQALLIRQKLYPQARYPQGHPDPAGSLNNLGGLHKAQGEYSKAEALFRRALEMREALYPKERFPSGHPAVAMSLNNLAILLDRQGEYSKAEPLLRRALAMRENLFPRERYPSGHPAVAMSLNNLAGLHQSQGEYAKAEPLFRRTLAMYEALYPRERFSSGHPDLVASLNNLAGLHQSQGEYAKAEALYRRALAMSEALFPRERFPSGHPDLVASLNNLATLHQRQGEDAKAEALYRRALTMSEALFPRERFPKGHPDLALNLNNLALFYRAQAEYRKAESLSRRALAMSEALFPKEQYLTGHPDLARSLNNLAALHREQGEYAKAEPLLARTLAMREALFPRERYPSGHLDLTTSLNNLALLHHEQGEHSKAEPLFARALKMVVESAAALAASAPEATALNYLSSLPLSRDAYLSATQRLSRVDAYKAVWQSKAALSRIYERRHLAVLAAASPKARVLWNSILSLRRERETLLLAPTDPSRAKARDKKLVVIDEDIRTKEADLLPLLSVLKRSNQMERATATDLRKALPGRTAFVDLLRYIDFEQDAKVPGKKGETRTPRYVAFVVTHREVKRIELGKAQSIEEMLDLWRRALQEGAEVEPGYAEKVHTLLWKPLQKHLPAKTVMVYVSPDAALNSLPWAALREGKSGRRLMEEHALAVVPHGVLLLDRLTEAKRTKEKRPTLLAMGAVAYDRKPRTATEPGLRDRAGDGLKWQALEATKQELAQIVALAGERHVVRRVGDEAGVATLLAGLPKAETAHLATHGFFADARFRTALQVDPKLFLSKEFTTGGTGLRIGAGSRSPLVLSGLVCSGANLPDTPNRGVLTADAIVGLDLRKMNLAVLSACESGLGETAGGEGVYGLVRAFHIAGTRNVAASLWKVDDEATAALMVLFYRHLWGRKPLPPVEALRQAQLALYRNPQHVKEWSSGRGPNLKIVLPGSAAKEPDKPTTAKRAPAKAWAAFVLSGPGD
jgi:CHAT domain-containing protein/Tfp pilus assembly protein PilF